MKNYTPVSYAELKSYGNDKGILDTGLQCVNVGNAYIIFIVDNESGIGVRTKIIITDPRNADQIDFEDNHLANCNQSLSAHENNAINVNFNSSDVPGFPAIPDTFKVRHSNTQKNVTSSYTTTFSRTGSGRLFGFAIDYNSDSVKIKLTINSKKSFELTLDQIESMQAFSSGGCDDDSGPASAICGILKKSSGNKVYFTPPGSLEYKTEIKIEDIRTGNSNKKMTEYMVFLTEET